MKTFAMLCFLIGVVMHVNASTVDDLKTINSTQVFAFGDYVSDGAGSRATGTLFGNGLFLDVKGGSVATNKGSVDIANTTTYTAVNGADVDYLSSTYSSYGSRLNCLRFKNADNLIALKPIAGSTIYLFGHGNNKTGTDARIPKFATDASLTKTLNEAPTAEHPATGVYVYKFVVPSGFDGETPLYIGSYNGDTFFSFIIVECPELFEVTVNSIPTAGGYGTIVSRTASDDNTSETITVKAEPNDNYAFKEWQDAEGNLLSTDVEYTFTATKDTEINAVFYASYSEKSPATKPADKNIPIAGESYTIDGTYNAGGSLGTAYGNMLSQGGVKLRTGNTGNTIRFDVNPGWKITGITLSMYANDEGTIDVISASVDGNAVADFTTITLPSNTAKAAKDVTLENISAQTSIVFGFDNTNKVKNNQVFATYVISYDKAGVHNIDATCSPVAGGTIVLDQNTQADGETDEVILTATANENYTFKEWQDANGAQLSTANPYTFDATADKEVVAVFVENAKYTVTYELGEGVEGQAPAAVTDYEGGTTTIPANFTVYKEGHTLTGWTDGSNNYVANDIITIGTSDITLTPVFTTNEVSLADRTETVTLKWDFRRDEGAPTVGWQSKDGLIWVTQAVVNGKTIDVKCDFSTNPGKFNNNNNSDCTQINSGTTFTIPSCKGAVVSMECHGSFSISTTTIDGQSDYTAGTNVSYTVANTAESINIVIGDGSYYKYIQTELPVVEQGGVFEQVTLGTAISSADAGSVTVYPANDTYDINSEVTLTATENFGYDFVNWTDSKGTVLSTESSFNYTISADETLTANFKQVNTYELTMAVEGGANDYMVSYNPAPTMVDGKQMYEEGTVVGIVASSNAILTFKNWSTGETATSFSVTMNADKNYTAYYGAGDYIVGWDFMKRGGSNRPADFASTVDNETATIYLINESGATAGWLDKSNEAAGGYESFEGAAVNWKNLGEYWYQFEFNASEFTDIRVDAEMMYNYNVYTTIKVQYSVDGSTWTDAGTLTMSEVKTKYPISVELGEDADNAEKVYVRYYPDKTAGTDGTVSANDGTVITNIFVYGTQAAVDDGQDPTLTSSIPATGATGASATGKIVLNFHEKVTLAADAVATIGTKEVTGAVSGTSITFAYTGLDYNTQYTFTLPANSVIDLTGNACKEDITIEFTTIAPPTVTKAEYDAIVTNAEEFLAALKKADGSTRFRIFLHDGTYDLGTACLTSVPGNVSLIGESMENTIIMNDPQAEGISVSATLCTGGENIYMQDLTIESADYDRGADNSIGRCVALQENASKAVYKNVRLLSNQDTYYTRATKRTYWEGGMIAGTVDYLCGGGDVFFNGVTLYNNKRSNGDCITAPATSSDWGYVFSNCTIDGDAGQNGSYSLGRPWQGSPRAVYINTTMKIIPSAEGWSDMGVVPGLFAEYNSRTASGAAVDCGKRKTSFKVDGTAQPVSYDPVLTEAEAAKFTIENVLGGDDSWQPQLLTEQAQTPTVTVEEGVLTWNASDYVLLYAICKNGQVIDFTTENSWTIPATTDDAYYSVRAANEMGGLGKASEAVNADGEKAPVSTWKDISIDLTTSDFLEESEKDTENRVTVSLGLVVEEDGTLTRVAADNASANIVLDGKYWNDHGWNGFKATVPVEGSVKIGVGSCNYAGQTVTVKNADGDVVTSFVVEKLGNCWKNKKSDDYVAYGYYYGKATTLTIEYSSYIPYISVEAIKESVLVIDDKETECADFNPASESYDRVVYNRELNTGYTYGLICLPFAPDAESLTNFQFYALSSASGDAITFEEVDAPEAGRPYLYSIKEGATRTSTITGGATTFDLNDPTAVNNFAAGTWELVGSLKNETINCDATTANYVFNPVKSTLHKVTKTLTVYPYTAYVRNNIATSVATMRVYISGPTGIKEISRDAIEGFDATEGMFDLQGRAMSKPMKGQIYIQNGVKKIKR
ncbi:MAG: Ig-like domain-containing protein [Bacteroidaceae bacterium]|nr:Ig-like domain-containing protein [Bacteroidaceae bacterium]